MHSSGSQPARSRTTRCRNFDCGGRKAYGEQLQRLTCNELDEWNHHTVDTIGEF